jgi:hypothetical protein
VGTECLPALLKLKDSGLVDCKVFFHHHMVLCQDQKRWFFEEPIQSRILPIILYKDHILRGVGCGGVDQRGCCAGVPRS